MTEHAWIATELRTAVLEDRRRTRRLGRLISTLAARPSASIPAARGNWAAANATSRLLDEHAVEADAILAAHGRAMSGRLAAEDDGLVLALQDTTRLAFSAHTALEEAGPLAGAGQRRCWSVRCSPPPTTGRRWGCCINTAARAIRRTPAAVTPAAAN
jgi:hypothetical protein